MEDREERIRRRAYALWETEGRPEGKETEHWQRACAEADESMGEQHVVDAAVQQLSNASNAPAQEAGHPKG